MPAQDLAAAATVDCRGAAPGGALAAEFGSVREYCMRFEPPLLQEARAVSARCFMRAACCIIVCCFLRATCGPCNLLHVAWIMVHAARCTLQDALLLYCLSCRLLHCRAWHPDVAAPLRAPRAYPPLRGCAIVFASLHGCVPLALRPPPATCAQVVAAELSAGDAVRTAAARAGVARPCPRGRARGCGT